MLCESASKHSMSSIPETSLLIGDGDDTGDVGVEVVVRRTQKQTTSARVSYLPGSTTSHRQVLTTCCSGDSREVGPGR